VAAKKRSNNRLEFALARPTRKSEALLLAAQPERYVSQECAVGAVACDRHGAQPGVLCCDHVRSASAARSPLISFALYNSDVSGDGTVLVDNLLCSACATRFHLSNSKPIPPEIWESKHKFPYVCPACMQCLSEWQHVG